MNRKRSIQAALAITVAAASVILLAPAAMAKGLPMQTSATASVSGQGLAVPIRFSWRGVCMEEIGLNFCRAAGQRDYGAVTGDLWTLVSGGGLEAQIDGYRSNSAPPKVLGPRYTVNYVVTIGDHTTAVRMYLYPFAAPINSIHFPWSYTPGGQTGPNGSVLPGGWWFGSPDVIPMLQAHGLPTRPPAVPSPAPPAHGQPLSGDGVNAWPVWLGAGLLLSLVVAAAAFGRTRRSAHGPAPATA